METHKLMEALREYAKWCDANEYGVPLGMGDNVREAADALEQMQAKCVLKDKQILAAEHDLKYVSDKTHTCLVCKRYAKDPCLGSDWSDCFEWRGLQETREGGG